MNILHNIIAGIVLLFVIWWAFLAVVATFDLTKHLIRGLESLRHQRFSVAKLLAWTTILAIWMALTRGNLPLMLLGLLALGLFGLIRAGRVRRSVNAREGEASSEEVPVPIDSVDGAQQD